MRNRIALAVFTGCIAMLSCNTHEDNCFESVPAEVYAVDGPVSVNKNETAAITVSFPCMNGCGDFGEFRIVEESGNVKTIEVIADYSGCICTMDIPIRKAAYIFYESTAGTYELNFIGNDTLISHLITVN